MHGPDWGEHVFRAAFSLAGLLLLAVAAFLRGPPQGLASFEMFFIAGAFFGGSLLWSLWKLWRGNTR